MDGAPRLRTNYLGKNARYVDDRNVAVTKTLALVDTECRHKLIQIKEILNKEGINNFFLLFYFIIIIILSVILVHYPYFCQVVKLK